LPINNSGVTPIEEITNESSKEKAFDVARSACGSFHSTELEQPDNIQATLTTLEKAKVILGNRYDNSSMPANSEVWIVQLTGKWQITGGPIASEEPSINPNLPVSTPDFLNTCEVVIDPKEWHAFSIHQFWKESTP